MADGIAAAQGSPVAGGPAGGGIAPQGGGMAANPLAAAAFQRQQQSSPGAGSQAAAMMKISQAIAQIQEALGSLPTGSDVHKASLKAVMDLSKHFPGPTESPGPQQTMLQDQLRQLAQRALLMRVMQNQGGQSAGPPSTPMPGA